MTIYYFMMFMFLNFLVMFVMIFPSNLYKFHPLTLSLLLIIYTIIICFKLNFLKMIYWYSYILFLVMIGGLMILFMYFTSLTNNQVFYFKIKYNMYLMIKVVYLFIFIYMIVNNFDWSLNLIMLENDFEIWSFHKVGGNLVKLMYLNLLEDFCMDMNLYMILYLFLTMICSVLICFKAFLPLRQLIKN